MKILNIVSKLMRFRPVISWTMCGFILALSVAYYETGTWLNVDLLVASFVSVMLIQGILSHAVNDLCDEEVDRDSDMGETGRTKVLLNGMATRLDLIILSLVALQLSFLVMLCVYNRLGSIVLVFASVGFYAAICYSLSPWKLGWRPFAEWTIVYPVITTLVVAVHYMATEQLSIFAFVIGTTHALFNIRWFMDSRMVDIEPDERHGKITTPIFLKNHGLDYDISYLYTLFAFGLFSSAAYCGYLIMFIPLSLLSGYMIIICVLGLRGELNMSREYYVKSRLNGMKLTVINTIVISAVLTYQKVYIV